MQSVRVKSFLRYHIKDRLSLLYDWFYLNSSKEAPILIFTMAKVGSMSVYSSIRQQSKIPCFHIHELDEKQIHRDNQRCFDAGIFPDSKSPAALIKKHVIQKTRKFKIISLFRNPIERQFSAFFDAFELFNGTKPENYQGTIVDLISSFHRHANFNYTINWYEKQFLDALGLNVYNFEFDKSKKYITIEQDQFSTLLIDCNLDNTNKNTAIAEFTGIKDFQLIDTNITSNSSAGKLYSSFRDKIRLDHDMLASILSSKYTSHFFSDEERKATLKMWGRTPQSNKKI